MSNGLPPGGEKPIRALTTSLVPSAYAGSYDGRPRYSLVPSGQTRTASSISRRPAPSSWTMHKIAWSSNCTGA